MKLSPEQRAAIGRLLKEKIGDFPACPLCRNATGWSIAGELVAPGGAGPFVALSCTRCGHTHLLHARLLGLDA